jgi:RimJ/RimL family protein N-acetyltransferase
MHESTIALTRVFGTPQGRAAVEPQPTDWRQGLPTLNGKLLTLRELAPEDSADLLPLLTADEVIRFLSPPPRSAERFADFIESTRRERSAGRYAGFAIVPAGQRAAVGLVQLRQLEPGFTTAEWGVAMGSAWWGRGLFEDAGRLLLDFAFQTLGSHRIEARVASQNARGIAAVAKLGGVAEGVLRRALLTADGTRHDQVLWSWLDEDWRRPNCPVREERLSWVH